MTVHIPSEPEAVASGLATAAGRHFGCPATIEGLTRQSGGASRQTWSFDAIVDGTRHELILRRDPPTLGASESKAGSERSAALDRGTEFRVIRAAGQTATAARLQAMGVEYAPMTAAQLGAFQKAEITKWEKVAKDAKLEL